MIDVTEHTGMVWSIALQFHKNIDIRNKYELDDLFQTGYVGLLKAVKNFDKTKGTKFSTYAFTYVKFEIIRMIRDDRFYPCKDRKKRIFANIDSLDKNCSILNGKEEITRVDILTDSTDFTEDIILRLALNSLSEEHKRILQLRYYAGKSQVEIAKKLNVSQPKIHRIEKQALEQLKEYVS